MSEIGTKGGAWGQIGRNNNPSVTSTQIRKLSKRETAIRMGRGQVPAKPIIEAVERSGQNPNFLTTPRIVYRWRKMGFMPFNSADRIMTTAGLNLHWHSEELKWIYDGVNLNVWHNQIPRDGHVLHGDMAKYDEGCRCEPCEMTAYDTIRRRKK